VTTCLEPRAEKRTGEQEREKLYTKIEDKNLAEFFDEEKKH
jgi:hypothetical protein